MTDTSLRQSATTSGDSRHLPELDGIRGVAILCVLVSHGVDFLRLVSKNTAWGLIADRTLLPLWGGVDLFFALSGFLISGILLRSRDRPTYFSSFYARRALRIFPIYYGFLILQLCLGLVSHPFARFLPSTLLERASYFLYIQNWPVFWASWTGMAGIFGVYWSLAVEEQFYMVWPTIVRFLKPQVLLGICLLGTLLGWVERYAMIQHLGLQLGILQWPFSRLDGLFLGAALALYQHISGKRTPMPWAAGLFTAGALLYAYLVVIHPDELGGAGRHLWTTGISAFALMSAGLIAAAQHRPPWLHRILTTRLLVAAGTFSYGMYVYHLVIYTLVASGVSHFINPVFGDYPNPFICFSVIFFAILVTMGVAWLSFRFFESPILALKRRFPSPSAPV